MPHPLLRPALDRLITLFYPAGCLVCGGEITSVADGPACDACWEKTGFFAGDESACSKCGMPVPTSKKGYSPRCHRCDDHAYDAARSAAFYEHAAKALVIAMKSDRFLCERAADAFFSSFLSTPFYSYTRLIPVPLSRKRLHERGFNQAELLASALSIRSGIPVDDVIERVSHTAIHRVGMDRKAREQSVNRAFRARDSADIAGELVLLIDDVYTSGATVSACAAELKKAGAERVGVLTFARTRFI